MTDEYEQAIDEQVTDERVIDEDDELTTEPEQLSSQTALFDEPVAEAVGEGVRVYERLERRLLSPWLAILFVLLALVATWLIIQAYR
jgi:hypothetical protein